MSKCIIFVCFISLSFFSFTEQTPQFLSDEHIKQINAIAKTWKAKRGFLAKTSKEYVAGLLGSKDANDEIEVKKHDPLYAALLTENNDDVPKNFDARKRWKSCSNIGHVGDQGNCGSCWAFGTTGAFADRLCVATKGAFNEQLSVEKLTFCCWRCGFGCHGGYPAKAWKYFKSHGVVTGGDYGTNEGCEPYKVPPCFNEKGEYVCSGRMERHHWCHRSCYGNATEAVRFKTSNAYVLDDVDSIMKDILTYGPTEASFEVYDDFPAYESGVYQKTPNASYMGGHSVKLIGWGQEKNGPPYWLLVNSWSKHWGEKGTFRIIRGRNECGIESSATAGVPSI